MANSQDSYYLSLLALAERFRTQEPANIKSCVQCLQAVLTFRPPPKVESRTHLQLGNLFTQYTNNVKHAQSHFEQAWNLSMNIVGFDDVKFEAAVELAKLYQVTGSNNSAKTLLRRAIDLSQQNIFWHCRLIFQTAQINIKEQDFNAGIGLLQAGLEYTHMQGVTYTHLLFMLSKLMVMMMAGKPQPEIQSVLSQSSQMVEQYNGGQGQKEHLRVRLNKWVCRKDLIRHSAKVKRVDVVPLSHHLKNGQVKSAKPALKQLQQSTQNITELSDQDLVPSSNSEFFVWLPREQLCILAFLVSVMHSVQAGHMEKAQKYTDKALLQIVKLKNANQNKSLLGSLEIFLHEHSVICHLVIGSKESAIKEIAKICKLLQENDSLMQTHRAQLHTLLAIYSMSINNQQAAENQFKAALKHCSEQSNHELWTFVNLNLAVVFVRCQKTDDFLAIMDKINPDDMPSQSYSLKAAAYYVQGLQAFFTNKHDDGKRYLRESLKMANAEDLNRLTSCSLVLLGHIFLALGSPREASNMVSPAMQLASKIPDLHLQLWASAILKDLHRQFGDTALEQEAKRNHSSFSQTLLKEHTSASNSPHNCLLTWVDGPLPPLSET